MSAALTPLQRRYGAEIVEVEFGGKAFRCSRRTHAHLLWTDAEVGRRHPGAYVRVMQGCYNSTVEASEGTHDYDACLDVEVVGLPWGAAQRLLRELGWAAYWRTPAQGFVHHVHMISLGFLGKVGKFIDGGLSLFGRLVGSSQVADYYNHALALAGRHDVGDDPSWFPGDTPAGRGTAAQRRAAIDDTIFDYAAYLEDTMPLSDDDLAKVRAAAKQGTLDALNEAVVPVSGGRRWSVLTVLANLRTLVKNLKQ